MMRLTCQLSGRNNLSGVALARISRGAAALMVLLMMCLAAWAQDSARDAEGYAIFVSQRNGSAELYLLDLNTRQVSQLTNTGRGHVSPMVATQSQTLVFASRQGAGYELFRGEISPSWRTRRPTLVGLNRLTTNVMDEYSPSVTADGGMIAFSSGVGIELMSSLGFGRQLILPATAEYSDLSPAISPDGKSVAFVSNRGGGGFDLWLYVRATSELRQLTRGAGALGGLSWSGDSKRIAFTTTATNSESSGIALAEVESGGFRILSDRNDTSPALSARGDRILFTSSRDGDPELYMLYLSTGRVERLTNSAGLDDSPSFLAVPARPGRTTP